VAWARAQGAEVLSGQAFELGGRLPYQPLVEALRERLEAENAPDDLLEDLWLAELSCLLPELRVRYPDLPAPTGDELAAKVRLFEAVARLLDALAQRAPLVLLLDDLHWTDIGSLDLVRYLGRYWKGRCTRVLLLGTVRSEELEMQPALAALLADLERDLPVTHLTLQSLSQAETIQLVQSLLTEQEGGLVALGQWLFKRTGGQPFYLLEMLKMFQDRQILIPRLSSDGVWKLELVVDIAAALEQETFPRDLLPRSVRAMIQARLALLSPLSRQIMMACAVLGNLVTSLRLWQLVNVEAQEGVTALEEAVGSGILREEEAGMGRLSSYRFSHDLIQQVVYTEIGEARRQLLHQRAFEVLHTAGAPAAQLAYHALKAGQAAEAYRYLVEAGDEAMAVFAVDDAIMHYGRARALLHDNQREQTVPSPTEVEHLYAYLAQAYGLQNAWEKAREVYEELLAYALQQRLPALISMTLNCLAILAAPTVGRHAKGSSAP
jgi:predicted ATPase